MKKFTFLICLFIAGTCMVAAQGSLQFNQAKIVSNSLETVPSGKVWKITAMSGTVTNLCVMHPEGISSIYYKSPSASGFELNGNQVFSMLKYPTSGQRYNSNTCVTTGYCCDSNLSPYNQATDPLVLPMWLPAGTTLKSMGPGIFLSVLEFNVIP